MSLLKKIMIGICGVAIIGAGIFLVPTIKKAANIEMTQTAQKKAEYTDKIFDSSYVHNIDIQISEENWQDLLDNATDEKFYSCNLTIDGETIENVGIRAKGNSSLTQVAQSDSDRYSFKINFGKYTKNQTYHGLDKIALNNIISDTTFMKDYITYKMMGDFGVASPQVSYSYITINGEEWGLYLNVEDVDESFLERNYGKDYGNLYKPGTDDQMKEGMPEDMQFNPMMQSDQGPDAAGEIPDQMGEMPNALEDEQTQTDKTGNETQGMDTEKQKMGGHGPGGNMEALGADLTYTDDNESSYSNIFDNAETDITTEDKQSLISALKQIGEGKNLDEVIDIDATLRYFVVHNFVDNYDSYTGNMLHNYYLYQDNKGKLSMLPWDYNLAFGTFGGMGGGMHKPQDQVNGEPPIMQGQTSKEQASQEQIAQKQASEEQKTEQESNQTNNQPEQISEQGDNKIQMPQDGWPSMPMSSDATSMVNMAIDTPLSGPSEEDRPMWGQLINNQTYKEKYHQLFDQFIRTYIESGSVIEEINRVQEMIAPYIQKDPTGFYTYDEFKVGVETLKQFITLRGQSIRGQLDGTIPSTTEQQNANSDVLIEASSISISDMGSLGGMKDKNKMLGK